MKTKLCVKCGKRKPYIQYGILKVKDKELFYQHCDKCKDEFDTRRRKNIVFANIPNLKNEIWLPIKHFEELYEISNLGRVKTIFRNSMTAKGYAKTHINKLLSPVLCIYGYCHVGLHRNGKCYLRKIHRLVAQHYIPNPNSLAQVNHISGVKTQNQWYNLEWCTLQENITHSIKMGLTDNKGDKSPVAILFNHQAIEIYKSTLSRDEISKLFGVSKSMITHIKTGKTYSCATGKKYFPKKRIKKQHNKD